MSQGDAQRGPREVRTSGDHLDNVYAWGGDEAGLLEIQAKYADFFTGRSRVLDVGCGRGFFLKLLAARDATGVGIDLSPAMIEASREAGFEVELADANTYLEAHPAEFDGIFASHVIEHLDAGSGERFVRAAARALRPGGRLVVVTPRTWAMRCIASGFWRDLTHQRPYPSELLSALALSAGLAVVEAAPDRDTAMKLGPKDRLVAAIRRVFIGPELHDFLYGPGAHYLVADLPA